MKKYLISFISVCCFLLLTGQAVADDSIQVTSDNFTLSGQIDGAQGVDIISELERFRSTLLEIHDLPVNTADRRLDIYVVTDPNVFDVLGVGEDFVAVYAPTSAGPRALINGSRADMSTTPGSALRRSLRHEYAHHFIYTHLPLAQPRWLSEGLAEYYAGYTELPDGNFQIGTPDEDSTIVLSYPVEGWADMRGVLRSHQGIEMRAPRSYSLPPKGWARTPDNVNFFYAQNWALVHWAMNQNGVTDIRAGHEKLGKLAELLIGMESYLTRGEDILAPPSLQSWKDSKLKLDEIAAGIALETLGLPIQGQGKGAETSGTLEEALSNYIAGNPPTLKGIPHPERVSAQISVKSLSAAESAANQYREMSLTAGSNALINPRMLSLKSETEASPDLATSLLVSQAAQQFSTGGTQSAVNLINEARATNIADKDLETLSLQIDYGDFLNRNYMNPDVMRGKIRPVLSQYPNDPQLLGMMATTALGDARDGNPFAPEAQAALDKMVTLDIPKRDPLKALPLANLYLQMEDYQTALDLLYRAEPFIGPNSYALRQTIDDIERALKDPEAMITP